MAKGLKTRMTQLMEIGLSMVERGLSTSSRGQVSLPMTNFLEGRGDREDNFQLTARRGLLRESHESRLITKNRVEVGLKPGELKAVKGEDAAYRRTRLAIISWAPQRY